MVVDNPFYHQGEGNIDSKDGSGTIMFHETIHKTGVSAPMDIRWWVKDIPADKFAKLPPLPGMYLSTPGDFGTLTFVEGGNLDKFSREMAAMPSSDAKGATFATLVTECKSGIDIASYSHFQPRSRHSSRLD